MAGENSSSAVSNSPAKGEKDTRRNSAGTGNTEISYSEATDDDESEVRARFVRNDPFSDDSPNANAAETRPQTSPLLSSTPPTVAKSLIKAYPYLIIVNKLLAVFTWTNENYWVNIVIVSSYALIVLYFENIVTWFGHLIIVGIVTLYALLNTKILEEANLRPTLDDVVQALTATRIKADLLLSPVTSLSLTAYDIKRLLFTTVFLTPIYLIVTFLLIKPRIILLVSGIYVLTYHSSYSRVTRKILWKIKLARLICFYLTGLDFLQARNHSLFAAAFAKVQKNSGGSLGSIGSSSDSKPVRFTYVIYENQRRWLGIGWTSNLLSYERTPWTDEFLNESSSIESFQLPNTDNDEFNNHKMNGANWRWVDKTWRLDLTNDGAITMPVSKRSKTNADPAPDEGFIYYDNTWKKPSTEDSYSKYTRRRRWIRTAELVFNASVDARNQTSDEEVIQPKNSSPSQAKQRKSLRFSEPEINKPGLEKIPSDADETNTEKKSSIESAYDALEKKNSQSKKKED
ncbi:uncharacterized protein PRCAT00003234001 [Priceomyces carsonii]|uniref:uncharacterized protein n=1 Tax=Priceomyces carsonii TaxID=28549 RepID=UPI002ED7768B|nr:unnamed protein product [Priceomyces carsonii]